MIDKYWAQYKNEYKKKWHFSTSSKKKDYQYIGNLKTNYAKIDKLIKKITKICKPEFAVEDSPKLKNKKVLEKIASYKKWGFRSANTSFFRVFSRDYPDIFKKFIDISGLENASSSIIYQTPGHSIPWHYDTHIEFYSKLKKSGIDVNKKKIIRYMVFLDDWQWGHFFCVGSSIVNKWKKGDIITWNPHMHHCGCNGGMLPKITMNITGIICNDSLHKKKFKTISF